MTARVALISDHYPPAYLAGGPARSVAAISRHLEERGLNVYVIARGCDIDGTPLTAISSPLPSELTPIHGSSTVVSGLRQLRALRRIRPDVVYINSLFSIFSGIFPLVMRRLGLLREARWILAPRGELMEGALALKSRKKRLFLHFSNRLGLYQGIVWHATSKIEELAIRGVPEFVNAEIRVVAQLPSEEPCADYEPPRGDRGVFISRISRKKNLIGLIRGVGEGKGCLDIYGPIEDPEYWSECLEVIREVGDGRIAYRGTLTPEEVGPCLLSYRFAALPTQGENFGHAIYEALAVARPVLVGADTPFSPFVQERAGYVVDHRDVAGISQAFSMMSEIDQEKYEVWCRNALKIARRWYSDAHAAPDLLHLFVDFSTPDEARGRSGEN